jgi:hypothetical protein
MQLVAVGKARTVGDELAQLLAQLQDQSLVRPKRERQNLMARLRQLTAEHEATMTDEDATVATDLRGVRQAL